MKENIGTVHTVFVCLKWVCFTFINKRSCWGFEAGLLRWDDVAIACAHPIAGAAGCNDKSETATAVAILTRARCYRLCQQAAVVDNHRASLYVGTTTLWKGVLATCHVGGVLPVCSEDNLLHSCRASKVDVAE